MGLQKEDWERSRRDREDGDYYAAKEQNKAKDKKNVEVKIDKDNIYDRLVRITRSPDDEYGGAFSPDSKFIYYSATDPAINSRSFYKIKTDGTKPKSIRGTARVGGFVEMNGKFYFTARGGFKRIKPKDR